MNLNKLSNFYKKSFLVISDLVIIILSIILAYSLRLEEIYFISEIEKEVFLIHFILFFSTFYLMNIYKIVVRYFDNYSILKIIKSILIFQAILIPINFLLYEVYYMPRSISFITPISIGLMLLLHRVVLNYLINVNQEKNTNNKKILIYGINNSTVSLLKNIRQFSIYGVVEGFVDTSNQYKKRDINGIRVLKESDLIKSIKKYKISEIIVGPDTITKKYKEFLFDSLTDFNIRIISMDQIDTYLPNLIHRNTEAELNFHDIVNRPKIKTNKNDLLKLIRGKSVVVTGGGGSIGGELCKQILKFKPKKLIILDNSEINLFNIFNLLKKEKNYNSKNIKTVLGDCSDKRFLFKIFKNINIDFIYHAAAYKHVGFGEENPYSIIKNNILGTKYILELSLQKKVKNFIFISTDKAVNPTNMLGFTKKFGEILVQHYSNNNKLKLSSKFTIVRFGNVIGSSGSVIPIFLNQIRAKNALTLTDKRVERYFMSIPEAVELVLHTSSFNNSVLNIYALNMGKQIKIIDIAKRIIKLSGYTVKTLKNPKGDVLIKIIGLKKGEKISEELSLGENLTKTKHPKIMLCLEKNNKKFDSGYMNKIDSILEKKEININQIKKIFSI